MINNPNRRGCHPRQFLTKFQAGHHHRQTVRDPGRSDLVDLGSLIDLNGQIRHKNCTTQVGTLRETYGTGFAPGVRSNMKLDTLLGWTGASSLSQLLKKR